MIDAFGQIIFNFVYFLIIFTIIICIARRVFSNKYNIPFKHINKIALLFLFLFWLDKLIYNQISNETKSFQLLMFIKNEDIKHYLKEERFHNLMWYSSKMGNIDVLEKLDFNYIIENPNKLYYDDCIKNLELKTTSSKHSFFYGKDNINNVVCKLNIYLPIAYPLPIQDFERIEHTSVLTISKKEIR